MKNEKEERRKYIREITEAEADQFHKAWDMIFINNCGERPWGGLFLYRAANRERGLFHRKYIWIAIDDSDGRFFVREFKKKEKAIEWLCNSTGPKKWRL